MSGEGVKVMMSDEALTELKAKYPNLTDEQLQEILGKIHVINPSPPPPPPAPRVAASEGGDEVSLERLLAGMNTAEMSFTQMILYLDYLDRRDTKKKEDARERETADERKRRNPEVEALQQTMKSISDKLESLAHPSQPPSQSQTNLDTQKIIEGIKTEYSLNIAKLENLVLGKKLEDVQEKAEEEKKTLEGKVAEQKQAAENNLTKLNDKIDEIRKLAEKKPEPERKGFLVGLGETIETELGNEIKEDIVNTIKERITGGGAPIQGTGEMSADAVKVIDKYAPRILRILENVVLKMPSEKPAKQETEKLPPAATTIPIPIPPPPHYATPPASAVTPAETQTQPPEPQASSTPPPSVEEKPHGEEPGETSAESAGSSGKPPA